MEIELADELLRDWYDWSRQWRPDLDMPHLGTVLQGSQKRRRVGR